MDVKRYEQFMAKSAAFRESVLAEYSTGKTQAEVAQKFRISRQRVNQIVNYRASTARKAVQHAVRDNKLPKVQTLICVDCGKGAVEYDHRDYKYPLKVDAVCKTCHNKRGRGKNRTLSRAAA